MQEHHFQTQLLPRNIRIVYFVPKQAASKDIFELLIHAQQFWGGRLNPIVPVCEDGITANWRELLGYFDPDYIYFLEPLEMSQIEEISQSLKMNPTEILPIDVEFPDIYGLKSVSQLAKLKKPVNLIKAEYLVAEKSPLRDYYRLNYLLDDRFDIPDEQIGHHRVIPVNEKSFPSIEDTLINNDIFNSCALSIINTDAPNFRIEDQRIRPFELIIGKDGDCTDDLLYYWNRRFYSFARSEGSGLFITINQLDLLIKIENFKQLLFRWGRRYRQIELVSFSLGNDKLSEIAEEFKKIVPSFDFKTQPASDFPFTIRDAAGYAFNFLDERPEHALERTEEFLCRIPRLSTEFIANSPDEGFALEIDIKAIGRYGNFEKLFALETDLPPILQVKARVSKARKLVAFITYSSYQHGILNLIVPDLYNVVSNMFSRPYLEPENGKILRNFVRYNDGSHRLKQFIGLFSGNLEWVDEFIFDRFWSDLFYNLTTGIGTEADTVTFDVLLENYYQTLKQNYSPIGRAAEIPFPEKQTLSKGLKKLLQQMVENKVFLPGYVLKCPHCSSKIWYGIATVQLQITCLGCWESIFFTAESPISYKLNHLIKNNIGMRDDKGKFMPDGNLTAIKTIIHLSSRRRQSFEYIPQIDIFSSLNADKPVTDLDIVVLLDGKLIIGECKHDSQLFSAEKHKCLENLLWLSRIIRPDAIIISCTIDNNGKLKKAQRYLEHQMKTWKFQIPVHAHLTKEPEYHHMHESRYFLD